MKLAITGGAGFLGYHVANQLGKEYDEIVIIDIAPIDLKEYPKNVKYYQVDVRDLKELKKVLKGVGKIVHAAAALPLWKRKDIYETNINGTQNVLEAAIANQIKRVVYISSTAVYGVPEKHPIYENDPLVGVGPYGESKIEAERICQSYRQKGLCVPIIRPKTFIGTGRLGVFQILYDWVKDGKRIPIIGDGNNRYQLLEVEDLVEAIKLVLDLKEEVVNDVFNIGAEKFKTVKEDVGALCEFAGTGASVMPIPSWLVKPFLEVFWYLKISPLYKWVYDTADKDSFVAIEKAKQKLGWQPKYSNAQSLIKSYKWYLKHYDEVNKVGTTHRVAWRQGVLGLVKKLL